MGGGGQHLSRCMSRRAGDFSPFFTFLASNDTMQLLSYDPTIQILQEFMAFVPSWTHTKAVSPVNVEGTIVTLGKLDAFIATKLSFLQANGSRKVLEHRQKLHYDTFSAYISVSFDRLVGTIGGLAEEKYP